MLSAATPVQLEEGEEAVNVQDNATEAREALLSHKSEFDMFWNGRLVPNTRVSFDQWKWAQKKRNSQLIQEAFHRLTGCLFFDSNFGVTQNKLTFINTEILKSDKVKFYAVNRRTGEINTKTAIDNEFFQWLKECTAKYDKYGRFFQRESHEAKTRPDLKHTANSRKLWATFRAVQVGNMELRFDSICKFRANRGAILFGKVKRFYVVADNLPDDQDYAEGFGGDVEVVLEPSWVRAACEADHRATKGRVTAPVGNIEFKQSMSEIAQEFQQLEDKFPAELAVEFTGMNLDDTDEDDCFTNGIPASVCCIFDKTKQKVPGRLPGNLCTIGHHCKAARLLDLKVEMILEVLRNGIYEEVLRNESNYNDKEGGFAFDAVDAQNPGNYLLKFQVVSNIPQVTDQLASKVSFKKPFRIRPNMAVNFECEIEDQAYRLGQHIPLCFKFKDNNGDEARAPSKFKAKVEVKSSTYRLNAEPSELQFSMAPTRDDTSIKFPNHLTISGDLLTEDNEKNDLKTRGVDLIISIPEHFGDKKVNLF